MLSRSEPSQQQYQSFLSKTSSWNFLYRTPKRSHTTTSSIGDTTASLAPVTRPVTGLGAHKVNEAVSARLAPQSKRPPHLV
jgi:hypothetical protein